MQKTRAPAPLAAGDSGVSLDEMIQAHLVAVASFRELVPEIEYLATEITSRLARGGIVYTFGNGGSAADAQHLTGELIGRFLRERRPLASVALSTDPSVTTCIANDYGYDEVLARQINALAGADDVLVVFSTTGRSPSVLKGIAAARGRGAFTILLTGSRPPADANLADHVLRVASPDTQRVQEVHVLMLHLLSEAIDRWAAESGGDR